jgi:hypothetical protein
MSGEDDHIRPRPMRAQIVTHLDATSKTRPGRSIHHE